MYIKFNNIKLHNFFSFEDADLNLNDNGFVFVNGINNNSLDNAASNGAGKSTIFEAICWCLTGETLRGIKQVTRNGDNDGCFVSVNVDIDGSNYNIIRSQDYKGKLV